MSCILLPLNKSERLERIMARKEVVLLLPLLLRPPSVNHPPLITSMMIMMEIKKGGIMVKSDKGIKNLLRGKKKPSNPLPLQRHPSLDITLSLSLITPLDHILDTPSPPSPPPPPQPPIMGHPIYFNMFDYHRVNYLCCFHNQNLILSLRDEMNFMFAHLEYLLTFAIASPSPPHP
ncbi:hypothetical protein Tco_0884246 [Tanacetum coccineum]